MTAGLVKVASQIQEPDEVYVAISTGVLSRALQIAWPNAKFTSVAVARNLKAVELGLNIILGVELHIRNYANCPAYHCHIYFDLKEITDIVSDSINALEVYSNQNETGILHFIRNNNQWM